MKKTSFAQQLEESSRVIGGEQNRMRRTLAQRIGKDEVAGVLQETLNEEGKADHELTRFAERRINIAAAHV